MYRGRLVKQFRQPSAVQELILSAFEEQRWACRIDDPLPPKTGQDCKRRLADAICRLNLHQVTRLLNFVGDGTGRGVMWRDRGE